jgi:predicted transcriptional regulator of viral defense system
LGIITGERAGLGVRVTSLERTLVDVIAQPDFAGGWEEIWRSLETIPLLDVDNAIDYALLLDNATTISKVGFFLEQHKENFGVSEKHLKRLEKKTPQGYHYLNRSQRMRGIMMKRWHLIVPENIVTRNWEEPHDNF